METGKETLSDRNKSVERLRLVKLIERTPQKEKFRNYHDVFKLCNERRAYTLCVKIATAMSLNYIKTIRPRELARINEMYQTIFQRRTAFAS